MTGAVAVPAGRRRPPADRFDRRLLPSMMLGAILNPINSSIIAVALVPIALAFGAPAAQTAWLVSALYVATAIGQPVVGRLVDRFGPRPVYLVGVSLTGIAGIIGMLAPALWVLVVARVILGFGTCAGYPSAMSLIRRESDRAGIASPAGVLTVLSVSTQTVAVIGPTLGGLLIGLGGWRATFAVNIPLSLACLVLGAVTLPREPRRADAASQRRPFDLLGIALFTATLVTLLFFLMAPAVSTLWLLGVAVAAACLFAWRELRAREPFIDVRVFAGNVPLIVTFGRAVLAAVVSYAFLYGYTQWLEDDRGLDPTATGLLLLPTFVVGIAVASLTGRRAEVRAKLIVGAAAQLVACGMLLFATSASSLSYLAAIGVIIGIPQGLVNLAVQNALFHQADPVRIGASSGLLRTFMYLGAILAAAASGLFFPVRADDAGLRGLATVMVVAALVLLASAVMDRSLGRVDRLARGAA